MNAVSPIRSPINLARLRGFIISFAELLSSTRDEESILESGGALLGQLIARDDWLPDEYARPDPAHYRQYLLHCDGRERFSVVSFVWGPGQATPIHDHTVWGLVGVLRGAERIEAFRRDEQRRLIPSGPATILEAGKIDAVSPRIGDLHRVANAIADRPSVSIHVYGANIGAVERATYDDAGRPRRFVSGYANASLPNLWDRSSS
jgi:predicted metal-dependent enzyme (double-stranded beta helix superfamily)